MRMKKTLKNMIICMAVPVCLMLTPVTSLAGSTADTSASVMRLEKTRGTVKVTQSSGKDAKVIEKMRLNSGDDIKSSSKSYAYISLDDSKAVKLDENSEATVRKSGKKLEVDLKSGNLLFDVDKALSGDESFEIKTATMTMGIRGTCAQVEKRADNAASVTLLDGSLNCTLTDPATGKSQSVQLKAGEHADFLTGEAYANGGQIIKRKATYKDLKGFSLQYILENKAAADRILKSSGIDLQGLTRKQVEEVISGEQSGAAPSDNGGRTSPTAEWYSTKEG